MSRQRRNGGAWHLISSTSPQWVSSDNEEGMRFPVKDKDEGIHAGIMLCLHSDNVYSWAFLMDPAGLPVAYIETDDPEIIQDGNQDVARIYMITGFEVSVPQALSESELLIEQMEMAGQPLPRGLRRYTPIRPITAAQFWVDLDMADFEGQFVHEAEWPILIATCTKAEAYRRGNGYDLDMPEDRERMLAFRMIYEPETVAFMLDAPDQVWWKMNSVAVDKDEFLAVWNRRTRDIFTRPFRG